MRSMVAAMALIALVPPATAQTSYEGQVHITAKGQGAWSLTCQFRDLDGHQVAREIKGGKKHWDDFAVKARSGQCSYEAAADQPLTITIEGILYGCPLPAPERANCRQQFVAGASGEFAVRRGRG